MLPIATGEIEVPVSTSTGTLPATTLPQGAQTTLQARRLYCGNIPLYITEVIKLIIIQCS